MDHMTEIRSFVAALLGSSSFHALIIQSEPGWGKSTSVEASLRQAGHSFVSVGSYTTPLALFRTLQENPDRLIVMDDCSGAFADNRSLALLKAACWTAAGSEGRRTIRWESTSSQVTENTIDFTGKIIFLVNSLPENIEANALVSRSLCYRIRLSEEDKCNLLTQAAQNLSLYPNPDIASKVLGVLLRELREYPEAFNFRSLRIAYELAESAPEHWESLFLLTLPNQDPLRVMSNIAKELPVEQQARRFSELTGLSRRSFFLYRQRLKQLQ